MDQEGSLVVIAAVLASMSASSLPGVPLCLCTHRRVVGSGRTLRADLASRAQLLKKSVQLLYLIVDKAPPTARDSGEAACA